MKGRRRTASYDVVFPCEAGAWDGAPATIAQEISALAAAGYRCGILPLSTSDDSGYSPARPALRACVTGGLATVINPRIESIAARLIVMRSATRLAGLSRLGKRTAADRVVIVAEAPPFGTDGTVRYGLAELQEAASRMAGVRPEWAPAWPIVRLQIEGRSDELAILGDDWPTIVDPARWRFSREAPRGRVPLVGRHAIPRTLSWPSTVSGLLACYPASNWMDVRLLGVPTSLLDIFQGRYPGNWQVLSYGAMAPERFLRKIDFYAFSYHEAWQHGLDRGAIEALASGAVPVVPPIYRDIFEEAAVYASAPEEIPDLIAPLHRTPHVFREMVAEGRRIVESRHAPNLLADRVSALIGPPERKRRSRGPAAAKPLRAEADAVGSRSNVLFVTSNGTGLGHITRLLAVARHLPPNVQPIFATFSQAATVVRRAGYHVEHVPFHTYIECHLMGWNRWLEIEIGRLVDYFRTPVVLFDGNVPYDGFLRAIGNRPDLDLVWCRRAMWQTFGWDHLMARSPYFDLIIEPGELAAEYDRGATAGEREDVRVVPPIVLAEEGDLLDRRAAREALGLDMDRPAVLIQLGSGNNTSIVPVIDEILAILKAYDDFQLVMAEWIMAEHAMDLWPEVKRLRDFPNTRFARAFDFSISAAGYNSFHELLSLGVPTIFSPTEIQELDKQAVRAVFAEEHGLAYCLQRGEIGRLAEILPRIMDPADRRRLAEAGRGLFNENGARVAASIVAGLTAS